MEKHLEKLEFRRPERMDLKGLGCEDGTGSESCSLAVFGVSEVEPSGSNLKWPAYLIYL